MQYYCLGFAFNSDMSKVALVRKNRPEWQRGLLNGIGGKVESSETMRQGMVREFEEEAGARTDLDQWESVCNILSENVFVIAVYYTILNSDIHSMTDEEVDWYDANDLTVVKQNCITNLPWLIELCKDKDLISGRISPPTFHYVD